MKSAQVSFIYIAFKYANVSFLQALAASGIRESVREDIIFDLQRRRSESRREGSSYLDAILGVATVMSPNVRWLCINRS
jgi:hypothetical protein